MKRIKKFIAGLISAALIWTSLPWTVLAHNDVRIIESVRTQVSGIAGLSQAGQIQFASNVAALGGQLSKLPSFFVLEKISSIRPEHVAAFTREAVMFINNAISRPNATPFEIEAGMAIKAALLNPHGFGTRIISDLETINHDQFPDAGRQAAEILFRLTKNYPSGAQTRSATAKALEDLRLDMPSLDAFYDRLRALDAKHLQANAAEVLPSSFVQGVAVNQNAGLLPYKGGSATPNSKPTGNGMETLRSNPSASAHQAIHSAGAGNVRSSAIPAMAAVVALLSVGAVVAMLSSGVAFPVLSIGGLLSLPKAAGWLAVAGLIAYSAAAHEWAHARTALHYGDPTAKLQGRMTLNPLAHIDRKSSLGTWLPVLGLVLGGFAVGRAKPVPVNPALLNGPGAIAKISLAGPLMSFFLGMGLTALGLLSPMIGIGFLAPILNSVAVSNFLIGGINLLPVVPLDGSRIFAGRVRPAALFQRIPRPATIGIMASVAVALALVSPAAAIFVAAGWRMVNGRCVSEEEEAAIRRAIEDENRRKAAYENLRRQFWLHALDMEKRLLARKAAVLVDTELVTYAAMDGVVKTLDQLWRRWTHETPEKEAQADQAWQQAVRENMGKALKVQGLLAKPDELEALLAEELPHFEEIAQKWQAEFSVAQSLRANARKSREQEASKKEGVRIEQGAAAASSAEVETRAESQAKKPSAISQVLGSTTVALIAFVALALTWPHAPLFAAAAFALTVAETGSEQTEPAASEETLPDGEAAAEPETNPTAHRSFADFLSELEGNIDQDLVRNILTDLSEVGRRPFAGRSKEVTDVLQVLSQKKSQKRSVLLVGPTGIGKGALIEHIASEIKQGTYALDVKFLELDLAKLSGVSSQMGSGPGAKSPVDAFFDDILPSLKDKAVIVIKGVEGQMGPGANGQFIERLRSPMERSGQRFVFLLESDRALPQEHFLRKYAEKIEVTEPNEGGAMQMLLANKEDWEKSYGVRIQDEAIDELVRISQEFLRRLHPMELIDNMERALRRKQAESQMNAAQASLNDLFSKLSLVVGKYQRTQAPKDYNEGLALVQKIEEEQARLGNPSEKELTLGHVKEIMAVVYPELAPQILNNEDFRRTLLNAIPKVRSGIVAQDEAVEAVGTVLENTAAGLASNKRPLGTFMMFGPTGVGKTQLARVLAKALFQDENAIVRLDMSEYMERHAVSRMIGAPPGYVGYEEGGQLTEAVRKHPYSVILLDEIEKAHPDVFNVLLQILEDGRLTDGKGRTVDFRRTIIIMTSNLASRLIQQMQAQGKTPTEIQAAVKAEIKNEFRPELLGRIDDTIVFTPLNREQVLGVGELLANEEIGKPLFQNGHELAYLSKDVLEHVADNGGYDPEYGARPMRRAMQKQIRNQVTKHLLDQKDGRRKISIGMKDGQIAVTSESLPVKIEAKNPLLKGKLGIWARHVLDPVTQRDLSVAALKTSYDSFTRKPLQPQVWGTFSLETPAPAGKTVFEIKAGHMDPGGFDPALTVETAPGGGMFGWIEKLRKEGYGDQELGPIQSWLTKALRCGKSAAAAQAPASQLNLEWLDSGDGHVFKITAPPLSEEETTEAYASYAAHFSKNPASLEESLRASDALAQEGHRSRALLLELKRGLAQVPGAHFGAYWDKNASTYWLYVHDKHKPLQQYPRRSEQQDQTVVVQAAPQTPEIEAMYPAKVRDAGKFVSIKPGQFQMGSPADQANRSSDEAQHTVKLTKGFEMQSTQVTQLQYFLVMGSNPSNFKKKENCDDKNHRIINGESLCVDHPVENVSWNDAQEFIKRLNSMQNKYTYRLPTEAEWEYAARAGTQPGFPYSFGHNNNNELDKYAWYDGNSGSRTHAVATKGKNPWGLYGIHGNVWEWTQDWYAAAYPTGVVTDPKGPDTTSFRVLRGGSWSAMPGTCGLLSAAASAPAAATPSWGSAS